MHVKPINKYEWTFFAHGKRFLHIQISGMFYNHFNQYHIIILCSSLQRWEHLMRWWLWKSMSHKLHMREILGRS